MKKIAILTEGGEDIGFGHLTRCLSLSAELERKGVESWFVVNDDEGVVERVDRNHFKTYKLGKNNIFEILKLIKDFDSVIVDSYILDREAYLRIKEEIGFLVCIDDNKRIEYPMGMVINGSVYAEELRYPLSTDIIYLLGPAYMPIRQEFFKFRQRYIKEKVDNILITFGGDGSKNMTIKIRNFILRNSLRAKLDIVIGGAFRNNERFINTEDNRVRYHYNLQAKDMLQLMQKVDIAISAGGQTLYELARTGTPTIGICVADNQVKNLEGWSKRGFLEYCGWYDDADLFKKLELAISNIQDRVVRERVSRVGQKTIDGKGAERIVEKILGALR